VASDLKIVEEKTGDVYVLENADPQFKIQNSGLGNVAIRFEVAGVEKANMRYDNGLSQFEIDSVGARLTFTGSEITSNKSMAIEDTIPKLTIKNTTGASGTIQFLDQNDVETARIFSEKTIGSVMYLLPDSNLSNKGLAINQEGSIFPNVSGLNELGVTSSRWEIMYGKDINLQKPTPTIVMKNTTPNLSSAIIQFKDSLGADKASVEFGDDQNLYLRADTNVALNAGSSFIQMEPAGHLAPDVPSTQDLGKSTQRWRTVYADTLDLGGGSISGLETAYGEMYMTGNATVTPIVTTGVAVKVSGTTLAGELNEFTHTNGRLTYDGTETKIYKIEAAWTWGISAGTAELCSMYLYKNGVVVSKSRIQGKLNDTLANYPRNASLSVLLSMAQNDYVELFLTNDEDVDDILVSYLQVNAVTVSAVPAPSLKAATMPELKIDVESDSEPEICIAAFNENIDVGLLVNGEEKDGIVLAASHRRYWPAHMRGLRLFLRAPTYGLSLNNLPHPTPCVPP
jgi:hypothetical protein